MPSVTHGSL